MLSKFIEARPEIIYLAYDMNRKSPAEINEAFTFLLMIPLTQ